VDASTPGAGAQNDASRPGAPDGSTPGGGDNSRRRYRPKDDTPLPRLRAGEYPCWQCGKMSHCADVCPTLDARLRDRLAMASRWSPLWASSGSRDPQRMGRRVAVAILNDESSRAILPPKMKVAPSDAATAQLLGVKGGLLPITGTVTLEVRVGSYSTPVTSGVVRGMSVPILLGTDYTDVHVPNICGPRGTSS